MEGARCLSREQNNVNQVHPSRQAYLDAPNNCRHCQSQIFPREGEKISQTRRKLFCNQTCSASYNNTHKRHVERKRKPVKPQSCIACGQDIPIEFNDQGRRKMRKSCRECLLKIQQRNSAIGEATKGMLFARRKNWQSARSAIQRHARKVFMNSSRPKCCQQCGYDRHIEVCHIRDVADFPDSAYISEINHIDNLSSLCPTHHWEFDNHLLVL